MSVHAIRTFLVEDHLIVRQGLKDLFKYTTNGDIVCVGEAASEAETMNTISDIHPDVVVVDLNLENSNGLSLIEKLIEKNPDERIVVFSMRSVVQTVSAAYRLGAMAYVTKADDPNELTEAIRAAYNGNSYFVPGMAEKLAVYQVRDDNENPRNALTDKEMALFLLLAEGVKQDEAAERLGLNARSIANRVVSIRKALNCDDADFTRIAARYGLITSVQ
jgi:two-component system invasion response regulator UvrY